MKYSKKERKQIKKERHKEKNYETNKQEQQNKTKAPKHLKNKETNI